MLPRCGCVSITATSLDGSRYGSGRRTTASITAHRPVARPRPNANSAAMRAGTPGRRLITRNAKRISASRTIPAVTVSDPLAGFPAGFRYQKCGYFMKSVPVFSEAKTHRRNFLGQMFGAAAAAGLSIAGTRAAAEDSNPDGWISEVKGTHRCLFDFPRHANAMPLLHILNYLNTYSA